MDNEGRESDYDGNASRTEIKIANIGFKVAILFVGAIMIFLVLSALFN